MACGDGCCKSAQASSTPAVRISQEPTAKLTTNALEERRSASLLSCCDERSVGREEVGCGSRQNPSEISVSQSCSPSPTETTPPISKASLRETCVGGCCPKELPTAKSPLPSKTTECYSNDTGKQGCCVNDNKASTTVGALEMLPNSHEFIDIEKSGIGNQHIVLSISGMTCTSCETKLRRIMATLPYISKLRTSLILARAEFDINTSVATVEEVIRHLARTTEFKCELISDQGSSLDFVCSGDSATVAHGQWPHGVINVRSLDRNTVRVDYDADVVGARDLIENGWDRPMQLAPMRPDPSLDAGGRHVWHTGLVTLLSACLTIPVLIMAWAPLLDREIAYGSASLALATIVQVCIAEPFYLKAIKALFFSRVIEMDLLIVLSTSAAYVFSVVSFGYMVAGKPLSTDEFFETSTLLVTLIMVGRWVASLARQKAAESISIRSLQAPTAILTNRRGLDKEIDARLLQYGDNLKVAPDSQIPTDGTVVVGVSEVHESMLTGKSRLVDKHVGSPVIAGSINGSGVLTRLPGDKTIATIASMVDEAKLLEPRIQDVADTVVSFFVPVVVVLTMITFVTWVAICITVRNQSGSDATIKAITCAITVLIVSCPYDIGLAVPMVSL
ncbi:P-type Cu(2+) transporter [Ascochyta rabiei]|uniref:P-type Cu(2+) transporter n=1 Tax=Didymella rabiei TaxID=5454 RepID=UPI0018FF9435|nr:P-type Cu(2+) transporter [Ascochyta rabiei]UPX17781.1 P-type Cu(2+) transporter [Ascochyta rabiei]